VWLQGSISIPDDSPVAGFYLVANPWVWWRLLPNTGPFDVAAWRNAIRVKNLAAEAMCLTALAETDGYAFWRALCQMWRSEEYPESGFQVSFSVRGGTSNN
jgi:hypothetical protein